MVTAQVMMFAIQVQDIVQMAARVDGMAKDVNKVNLNVINFSFRVPVLLKLILVFRTGKYVEI